VSENLVQSVSDTARWVAVYRAEESARPDALFDDPYAERLAGERGRAIAAGAPRRVHRGWSIVARTKLIDDLVLGCVGEGCDRVLNLAAGLDTRPYRLALPASLTWVEADLPGIIEEKERLLARESPVCRLVREKVDLADAAVRGTFLARAIGPALRALVITEGLLPYLDEPVVRSLGRDLATRAPVRWWILDLLSPAAVAMIGKEKPFEKAPLKFGPPSGVAFFESLGWRARDVRSIFRAAVEFHRAPWFLRPFALFPDANPCKLGRNRWAAVVRLERARTTPSVARRPGGQGAGQPSS
jgi:methyltransferase (TIGR00027 family)